MGIPVSLVLVTVGLVLALAVHPSSSSPVDVHAVGWIVFAVGCFGLLVALLLWNSWAGPGHWSHRRPAPDPYGRGVRRRTVVEEDDGPPPPFP